MSSIELNMTEANKLEFPYIEQQEDGLYYVVGRWTTSQGFKTKEEAEEEMDNFSFMIEDDSFQETEKNCIQNIDLVDGFIPRSHFNETLKELIETNTENKNNTKIETETQFFPYIEQQNDGMYYVVGRWTTSQGFETKEEAEVEMDNFSFIG